MSEPIDHHYLPIFYLRQWGNPDGRVIRYYRPYKAVVATPVSPSRTGYEPWLYTLEGRPPDQRQMIETEFMPRTVDTPAAPVLEKLTARRSNSLSRDEKSSWIRFLLSLHYRNPETLSGIQAKLGALLSAAMAEKPDEYTTIKEGSDPPTLTEWVSQHDSQMIPNAGKLMMPQLIDSRNVGQLIFEFHWWTVDFTASRVSLLTSDRPLVMTNGLQKERCVIALPLSPRLAFFASKDPQTVRTSIERTGMTAAARALNESVVMQAAKHVYGVDCAHLRFAENRLRR